MWYFRSPSVRVQNWVFSSQYFVRNYYWFLERLVNRFYGVVGFDNFRFALLKFYFFNWSRYGTPTTLNNNTSWVFSAHILVSGTCLFVLFTFVVELHCKSCKLSIVCIWNLLFDTECKTILIYFTNAIISLMYNVCGRNSSRHGCTPPISLIYKDNSIFNDTYSDVNKLYNCFDNCKRLRVSCRFWSAFISNWHCILSPY